MQKGQEISYLMWVPLKSLGLFTQCVRNFYNFISA